MTEDENIHVPHPNSLENLEQANDDRERSAKIRLIGIRQFILANKKIVQYERVFEWYYKTFDVSFQTFRKDLDILRALGEVTVQNIKMVIWTDSGKEREAMLRGYVREAELALKEQSKETPATQNASDVRKDNLVEF